MHVYMSQDICDIYICHIDICDIDICDIDICHKDCELMRELFSWTQSALQRCFNWKKGKKKQ